MSGITWTKSQEEKVFDVYKRVPYKLLSEKHPDVINVSNQVGHSPESVFAKIKNFASLDENLKKRGIKGRNHVNTLDKEIWSDFYD